MSLIVKDGGGTNIPLLPEDVYPAVCNMLVDLGDQYSKQFDKTSHKVLICWEIPSETLESGETRRLSKTYTATLNEKGNLRKDLIAWRGRDFTPDELKEFDLRRVAGAPCMLQIVHKVKQDGSKFASIAAIMKLPKGMPAPKPSGEVIVFDLDNAEEAMKKLSALPDWMQERVKESDTWHDIINEAEYIKQEAAGKAEEGENSAESWAEDEDDDSGCNLPF